MKIDQSGAMDALPTRAWTARIRSDILVLDPLLSGDALSIHNAPAIKAAATAAPIIYSGVS